MQPDTTTSVTTLADLMRQGGWIMWVLLGFSIVSLSVAVAKALSLRRSRVDITSFLPKLHEALARRGSMADALAVCRATNATVARVAEAGLRRFSGSSMQLEKTLETQANRELRRLQKGLGVLAATAATAPLLGFLGTVIGMIASFDSLASFGVSNPGLVAEGIKEALVTTAAGLIVAVPAQLFYNALMSKVVKIEGDIEEVGNFLLEAREDRAFASTGD